MVASKLATGYMQSSKSSPSVQIMPQQKPKLAGVPASAKGKGNLVTLHESPTPNIQVLKVLNALRKGMKEGAKHGLM